MILFGLAFAAPSASLSLGHETVANDPFIRRNAARLAVDVRPIRWVNLSLAGDFAPNLGEGDRTRLTKELVTENSLSPDLTRVMASGDFGVDLVPLNSSFGEVDIALMVGATVGAVHTVDDLDAQALAVAERNQSQVHFAWGPAIAGEVRWRRIGGRARVRQQRFREDHTGHTNKMRNLWMGMDFVVWLTKLR